MKIKKSFIGSNCNNLRRYRLYVLRGKETRLGFKSDADGRSYET